MRDAFTPPKIARDLHLVEVRPVFRADIALIICLTTGNNRSRWAWVRPRRSSNNPRSQSVSGRDAPRAANFNASGLSRPTSSLRRLRVEARGRVLPLQIWLIGPA